jgi:RecA/RadA recombinase
LFQSTVFPLSRIMQITGEEGSCKLSFQFEMMRWHHVYGGGSVFIENENKDSPEMRYSILQWNEQWLRRHELIQTYALEEWMDALTTFTTVARAQQDHADGPGHTIPIMFSVDSIMATAPQEQIDKIEKEGHASRNFALAANLIASYMRTMPQRIKSYPFTICGTNHLKPSTDFMGRPTSTVPGGKSVKFMETYEIEMHRAPSGDIDKLDYGGIRVRFVGRKNSLGPSRKQIVAELLWWYEEMADGMVRQRTAWDWDTATVDLLLSFETAKGKKTLFNHLRDICRIVPKSKRERKASCPTLGIDEPVEYRQIGAALERRPDLLSQIYGVLGIQQRRAFQPGLDYRDLLQQEAEAGEEASASLYEHPEDLPSPDADTLDPTGAALPPTEQDMTGEADESE